MRCRWTLPGPFGDYVLIRAHAATRDERETRLSDFSVEALLNTWLSWPSTASALARIGGSPGEHRPPAERPRVQERLRQRLLRDVRRGSLIVLEPARRGPAPMTSQRSQPHHEAEPASPPPDRASGSDASTPVPAPPKVHRLRLTGFLFETDKAFLLPRATPGMRAVARFLGAHPGARVLLSGHADTQGSRPHNRGLSSERAEATSAFLRGDVGAWLAWYRGKPHSRPWGVREDQHMLSAVLSARGTPFYAGPAHGVLDRLTTSAVRELQSDEGLTEDGVPGQRTRAALSLRYLRQEGAVLPAGAVVLTHGCGEAHPVRNTGDEQAEQENRRVEIFTFEGPIDPPPRAECPLDGCPEYPEWVRRAESTVDVDHPPGLHIEEFFARPLLADGRPEQAHRLVVPRGSRVVFHWHVDGADRVQIERIRCDGTTADVPLPGGGAMTGALSGRAQVTADDSAVFTLSASGSGSTLVRERQILVAVYDLGPGSRTAVRAGADWLEVMPA